MAATYTNSENQPVERVFTGPPLCNGYVSVSLDANNEAFVVGARTMQAVNYIVLTSLTGTAATTVLTATPVMPAGFEGQIVDVINATASSQVSVNDNSVAASGMLLGAKRFVFGPGRSITLQWSANYGSLWKRIDNSISNAVPNNSFTAHAGGGQANATLLNNNWSVVTTVASPGDSVKIDWTPTGAGWQYLIANMGANAMDLFPLTGDAFNNLAANTAISVASGDCVIVTDYAANIWQVVP